MHAKVQLIPSIRSRVMTGTKFVFIHTYIHTYVHTYIHTYVHTYIHTYVHTYIHTYILLKPIILTQEHRNSSKSLIRKFSPLQSFLFEKAKMEVHGGVTTHGFTSQVRAMVAALINSKKKKNFVLLNIYRFDLSIQLLWQLSNPSHLT